MAYDLTIADRCRDAGLRVEEVGGWQTRGSSTFEPHGSICHHTAGGATGTAPSLGGVINGFSGSAPGPLAHALQSRERDGNDIFYIVAAGRANHAGQGNWRGNTGNSTVIGLEIEHTGKEPLPAHRQLLAARFHAAMANGRWGAPMVCQHREWAPTRKIDTATNVDPERFRATVAEYIGRGGPSIGDEDMPLNDADKAWIRDCVLDIVRKEGISGAASGSGGDYPTTPVADTIIAEVRKVPGWIADAESGA